MVTLRDWIEAMRSGKYKQTTGFLKKDGCYCALGVLGDLKVRAGEMEWKQYLGDYYLVQGEDEVPWTDLTRPYDITPAEVFRPNDDGATFEEIADMLEERCSDS